MKTMRGDNGSQVNENRWRKSRKTVRNRLRSIAERDRERKRREKIWRMTKPNSDNHLDHVTKGSPFNQLNSRSTEVLLALLKLGGQLSPEH